jgi:predicted ATPase
LANSPNSTGGPNEWVSANHGSSRLSASQDRQDAATGGERGICAEQRGLVLDGRAAELERDVPFGVILEALNGYLGGLERHILRSLDEDPLAELASVFSSLSPSRTTPPRGLDSDRYRTQYAIRSLLERLVSRQPVAVFLGDVHWADAASVELIGHLVRRFRGPLLGAFAFQRTPAQPVAVFVAA